MRITVLCGGVGGARFLRGVREHVRTAFPDAGGGSTAQVTAIVNTGDDMWLTGLRIAPDLDSIMYTLAGENDEERGWGRIGETKRVSTELRAYGVGWPWFTLGDLDIGTHLARSHYLRSGLSLSEATARIAARWELGVTLLPVTDDEVETWVEVDGAALAGGDLGGGDGDLDGDGGRGDRGAGGGAAAPAELHFQEWWTRYRATIPARRFVQRGVAAAHPAPGVLDAIAGADVVIVAPSNPVVSIGTILGIPGVRDAVRATSAAVVGVSPIIGGAVVRGMADACLSAIGVATSAETVALHYGARASGGLLDAWLVDEADAALVSRIAAAGIRSRAVPLWMRDAPTSAGVAAAALALAALPPDD